MILNVCSVFLLAALTVLPTDGDEIYSRGDFRLPLEVTPVSYKVHLTPFLDNATFEGRVEMLTTPRAGAEVKTITLHAHPSITVRTVDVLYHGESRGLREPLPEINATNDFFVITVDKPISSSDHTSDVGSVVVVIEYLGVLNKSAGFYRSSYLNDQGQTEYLAATHFEPTHARKAFPCFDEPALKAHFQLTVIAPSAEYSALSNTPTVGPPTKDSLGRPVITFQQTPPMSTYLVATVVSKYDSTPSTSADHVIWSRPNAKNQRDFAAKYAASVMDALVQFTGIPYQVGNITKMDNVAVPSMKQQAMENWGLVIYGEPSLLVNETHASELNVVESIAHEYAHQFFGNLVSPAWWNVLWLSEGFATYLEYHAVAMIEPSWRMKELFKVDKVHQALLSDAKNNSQPMTIEEDKVLHPGKIGSRFDHITYHKGASVLSMVEHVLGTDKFRAGLKNYLTKMYLKVAIEEDLFDALAESAGNLALDGFTFQEFFRSWTNTPGYPLVTVTRDYETGTVKVTQNRFFSSGNTSLSQQPPAWITPVNWATNAGDFNNTKPSAWLKKSETLQLPGTFNKSSWVVVNNQQTGFYRVNYDDENWRLLVDQLQHDHSVLPPVTQAQLLEDAFTLARAGKLNYTVALDLTLFLKNQTDEIPIIVGIKKLSGTFALLENSTYEPHCMNYLNQLTKRSLMRLNSLSRDNNFLFENFVLRSPETFTNLVATQTRSGNVPPYLRRSFYCAQVRAGSPQVWQEYWQRFVTTNIVSEREVILSSLTCTKDPKILHQLLQKTTLPDSGLRTDDNVEVIKSLIKNPEAFDEVLKYVNEQTTAGSSAVAEEQKQILEVAVRNLAELVTDEDKVEKVLSVAQKLSINISDVVKQNLQWLQKYEETVGQWCQHHSTA